MKQSLRLFLLREKMNFIIVIDKEAVNLLIHRVFYIKCWLQKSIIIVESKALVLGNPSIN